MLNELFGTESPENNAIVSDRNDDSMIVWTVEEVTKVMKSLKNGKSPGDDLTEAEMIKNILDTRFLWILTNLYNGCVKYGVFPAVWKLGVLRVLLKSLDKDPSASRYYRPICLLSILSKVLEKLMKLSLRPWLVHPSFSSDR